MIAIDPPATNQELLAAYARAHEAGRKTGKAEGAVTCPRCGAPDAQYTFYDHCLSCTVICPCGFGMQQGLD